MRRIPKLHAFASAWPKAAALLVMAALDRGDLTIADVRTITLAMTSDRLSVGVWLGASWNDYPHKPDDDSAIGTLSLAPWLERVDAIARGTVMAPEFELGHAQRIPVQFSDPTRDGAWRAAWSALDAALAQTAIELATRLLAPRFSKAPQPVGVFIDLSGGDVHCDLVAYIHPQGAPLLPLREQRKEHGFSSVYPHGVLVDEGAMLFYPEGDRTGESPPSMRLLRFDDLERAELDDDEDELRVRPKGDLFDTKLAPGHTREEDGGPDGRAVSAMLQAHFRARRPSLFPGDRFALPTDATAFEAWLASFGEDHEKWNAVETLIERHGPDGIERLIAGVKLDGAVWKRVRPAFARAYLAADRPNEALAHLKELKGKDRSKWLEAEAHFARAAHDAVLELGEDSQRVLPFRALSLAACGRRDEAIALVSGEKARRDEDLLATRALLLAEGGLLEAAHDVLATAMLEGTVAKTVARQVVRHPTLAAMLDARASCQRQREASAAVLAAMPARTLDATAIAQPSLPVTRVHAPAATPGAGEEATKLRAVLVDGARRWAGDDKGRLVDLAGGRRVLLSTPFAGALTHLVRTKPGAVGSDGTRLALFDDAGVVLASAAPLERGDGALAAHGDLIAKGNGAAVDLWRVDGDTPAFTRLGTFAFPNHHFSDLAFVSPAVLAAASVHDVFIVDVADPSAPQVRARLRFDDSVELDALGAELLVHAGSTTWFVRADDPSAPCARAKLQQTQRPFVAPGANGHAWLVANNTATRVDLAATRVLERRALFDEHGSGLDDLLWLDESGDGFTAVTREGPVALPIVPWPAQVEAARAERAQQSKRVAGWVREKLTELLSADGAPIGVVRAAWFAHGVQLEAGGAASAPAVGGDLGKVYRGVGVTLDSDALRGDAGAATTHDREPDDESRLAKAVGRAAEENADSEREAAMTAILLGTRELVAGAPRAAGLVHLASYRPRGNAFAIIDVVATAGPPPMRAKSKAAGERALRDRLSSRTWYREVDAVVARARRDEAFRAEVLVLLVSDRLPAAARVALEVGDAYPEEIRAAWLRVATADPAFAMVGLLEHGAHADVRAVLERLADHADVDVALPARRAVGRADEPGTIDMVRRQLIEDVEGSGDELTPTLDAMSDASLGQLKEVLAEAYRRRSQHDRHGAAALLLPLVRAGITEIPEGVLEAAREEQQMEEFSGDFGFLDATPAPAVTALRHLVARQIARRLRQAPDGAPLWPAEVPLEEHRASWRHMLDVLWRQLGADGLLDALHDRLRAHLAHAEDRTLALNVLHQDLLTGDARAKSFGEALERAPYKEGELDSVMRMARLARVAYGWALVKEKRFTDARRVADAALADSGPDDGQVFFFDARLAWLESNDPQAALKRIPPALERASDEKGRGRLYNLYGAALDALGRFTEGVPWFEKAMTADPDDSAMYLSNIAEAYWKAGDKAQAVVFAKKSKARGGKTAIVAEILASDTRGGSDTQG